MTKNFGKTKTEKRAKRLAEDIFLAVSHAVGSGVMLLHVKVRGDESIIVEITFFVDEEESHALFEFRGGVGYCEFALRKDTPFQKTGSMDAFEFMKDVKQLYGKTPAFAA